MKKIILLLFLLQTSVFLHAQMARWVMHTAYDRIYMDPCAPVLFCDSLHTTSLWNLDGKRLAITADEVHPFVEGFAVTSVKGSDQLTGFYDVNGRFVAVSDYSIAYSHYGFSDGFLLVKDNWGYYFINSKGEKANLASHYKMYPFNGGVASCQTFKDVEKRKNPYYVYLSTDNQVTGFTLRGKPVDHEDVQFLSSLSDDGMGIAIIKEKVYLYNKSKETLVPAFAGKSEESMKKQLTVDGDASEYLRDMNDSIVLLARGNKKETVSFVFDKCLKPTRIHFIDQVIEFKEKKQKAFEPTSSFVTMSDDRKKVGIKRGDQVILPSQFDEVAFCFNNYFVVRQNGKWGMVYYDEALNFRLTMHGGKNISFRHKEVDSDVKLELPAMMSADKCRFAIDEKEGCAIDKISIETKNTENGNYVYYKCRLTIPNGLPDVLTEIQYPVQITFDGLIYPIVLLKTKAWHYKYINVVLDEAETTFGQGNVSFTLNIQVDKQPGDDDYPFQVSVLSDSLQSELVKISEMRYQCKLYALAEGLNHICVNIQEVGCPPSVFPFDITYVKPVEKKGKTPAMKEAVTIEKRGNMAEPAQSTGSSIVSDIIQQVSPVDALP